MDKPFTMAGWKDKIKKQKELNNLSKESNKNDLLKREGNSLRTISPNDLK